MKAVLGAQVDAPCRPVQGQRGDKQQLCVPAVSTAQRDGEIRCPAYAGGRSQAGSIKQAISPEGGHDSWRARALAASRGAAPERTRDLETAHCVLSPTKEDRPA